MKTEFRKAQLPGDLRSLMAFDRKVFPQADCFAAAQWKEYETYWLLLGNKKAGCCAFHPHRDFAEDIRGHGRNPARTGSLYITSTGLLPEFQGRGLGTLLKAWEIAFARQNGFRRLITNTRKSNAAMISINRRFGFRVLRITPRYYSGPADATVVMELLL